MPVDLSIAIPAELPNGFSGYAEDHILFAPPRIEAMAYDTLRDVPIPLNNTGCKGLVSIPEQPSAVTRAHVTHLISAGQ
jgi:hypothetical protein